ncbi:OLC1v1030701C1 [Oldenlandia corymbosa var. corymbosa]|uniref:OLC1v1030701C1 n=1 Tax=Oldenlandia corymbosa var. corymbosa TaxID=529605 RepID=A0AAV1CK83_OLDCO|nr:OLC1v1030701C1 [Oldenlandia corymbosa var. corymbosa]
MARASAVNPMAFDRIKAATHGVKPGDVGSFQPTEERVIVPFKSDARQLTLGPNFPSAPKNLKKYISLLNPESPYYKYENPFKFENWERLRVWPWSDKPKIQKAFVQWYHQLEPEYADTWRMAGIYDLLKFCTIGLGESRDLVEAVLGFWSGCSNVFYFLWGPMTPTLLDVCVITGLPAVADVAVDGNVTDDDAAAATVCVSWEIVSNDCGLVSCCWHNPGAPFCGPIWLLHFWLYMYFPSLKLEGIYPVESDEPLWLGVHQYNAPNYDTTQVFKTVFESNPSIEASVQQLSHDWWHKSFGEVCHAEAESGKWVNHGKFSLASIWSHLLSARDLFYGCKSAQSQNVVADMQAEYYPANNVARQFGFAQSVPHFDVSCWNTGRLGRERLAMSQYTTHRELMDLRGRSVATIPFSFCFNATPGFADWWYELSIDMYGSGYEAIKTSFGISKFAKYKSIGGVAETEKKGKRKSGAAAKTGGQSSKKSTATAAVRAKTSTGKDVPTSTPRSKRLIGRKRSASEVSNKENPVSVSESEEEEAESLGSEKGSAAVAEDQAAQKIVLETGGARSKKVMKTASLSAPTASGKKAPPSLESLKARLERTKAAAYVRTEQTSSVPEMPLVVALQQITEMFPLSVEEVYSERYDQLSRLLAIIQNSITEGNMAAAIRLEKNKLLSEQLIEQVGQLETNIKEAIVAELKAKEELEKAQAKPKQLEAELSGVVADTDVALDGYGRMTTVVNQLLPTQVPGC